MLHKVEVLPYALLRIWQGCSRKQYAAEQCAGTISLQHCNLHTMVCLLLQAPMGTECKQNK